MWKRGSVHDRSGRGVPTIELRRFDRGQIPDRCHLDVIVVPLEGSDVLIDADLPVPPIIAFPHVEEQPAP